MDAFFSRRSNACAVGQTRGARYLILPLYVTVHVRGIQRPVFSLSARRSHNRSTMLSIEGACQQQLPPVPKSPASPQQQLFPLPWLLKQPNKSSRISSGIIEFRFVQFIGEFPHLFDFVSHSNVCMGCVMYSVFYVHDKPARRVPSTVAAAAASVVVVAAAKKHQDQQQEQDVVITSAKTHVANLLSCTLKTLLAPQSLIYQSLQLLYHNRVSK